MIEIAAAAVEAAEGAEIAEAAEAVGSIGEGLADSILEAANDVLGEISDVVSEISEAMMQDVQSLLDQANEMLGETSESESGQTDLLEQQTQELSEEDRAKIKEETGWSDEIIDHIQSMEQYEEVYKPAGLHEAVVDGRPCLLKDIDMDYVDPKTDKTNRELMQEGRSPYDAKTGERLELHHMGQDYDSPFAELCENCEHGDGKDSILHDKNTDSWRQDSALKNHYNNVDRPNHWKERANEQGT